MENRIKQLIQSQDGQVNIYHALQSKWFGTQWSCSNSDYDELIWLSEDVDKPSKAEIDEEIARLKVEYDGLQYQRDRVEGVSGSYAASQGTGSIYPSTGEQFDMLYHELEISGSLTISGSWFNTVKTVNDANPKPEEDN